MRERGTVLWFSVSRGLGVIQSWEGRHILVHLDSVESPTQRGLSDGQTVEYSIEEGPEGQFAGTVRVIAEHQNAILAPESASSNGPARHSAPEPAPADWIALDQVAHFEITSEDPDHPIAGAICPGDCRGWRASDPGWQSIRICFDPPHDIHRIRLHFREPDRERTQQFTLRWSEHGGDLPREIVRQQWNFSPAGATEEIEDYTVELSCVAVLELDIRPDLTGDAALATLAELRVA